MKYVPCTYNIGIEKLYKTKYTFLNPIVKSLKQLCFNYYRSNN